MGTPRSADFLPQLRLLYLSGTLASTHQVARRQEGRAQLALSFRLSLQLFSGISERALPTHSLLSALRIQIPPPGFEPGHSHYEEETLPAELILCASKIFVFGRVSLSIWNIVPGVPCLFACILFV